VSSSSGIDVRHLELPDMPSEWRPVDQELLHLLKPDEYGVQTLQQTYIEEGIYADRWFLVANSLAFRCKSCRQGVLPGAIHRYITKACLPRPFNGLNEVLMFWREQVGQDETDFDSFTMRMGENIIPITADRAQDMYLAIELKTGIDLAWHDFRSRYVRRYKDYLRTLQWDPADVSDEQWKLVIQAGHREYEDRLRKGLST
jgi:hypothetical protein